MKDLVYSSKQYIESRLAGFAGKLEFQACNTLHHDILVELEDGVLDDRDTIDEINSSKLPTAEQDR